MLVDEILVGEMQVGEKTWSDKLKVGEILGHPFFILFFKGLKNWVLVNKKGGKSRHAGFRKKFFWRKMIE